MRYHTAGGHKGVAMLLNEKIHELFSDLIAGCHDYSCDGFDFSICKLTSE